MIIYHGSYMEIVRPDLKHSRPNVDVYKRQDISFSGEEGERIKFSFRSNIVNGELNMVLYDSAGNAVYTLDEAKALETFYTLDSSGTYTLAAECKDFIGEYKIKVYKAD